MGSKDISWEELAWESPCSGISSFTKFSLNSCSHSGISEYNGSRRSFCGFFLIVLVVLLAWSTSGLPDLSSTVVDTVTGEVLLSIRSSRSRVLVSLPVGDEDELEEYVEQWLLRLESVLEVDESNPEDELDKPGTTIGTKFSVLQIIRIPF